MTKVIMMDTLGKLDIRFSTPQGLYHLVRGVPTSSRDTFSEPMTRSQTSVLTRMGLPGRLGGLGITT